MKISLTEDGVAGIHGNLVLRRIADKPLGVSKCNVTRCGSISLIIGDDLNLAMLEDTHAGVRGAQVDSHRWCFRHSYLLVLSAIRCNKTLKNNNAT